MTSGTSGPSGPSSSDLGLGLRHDEDLPPRRPRSRAGGGRSAVLALVVVGVLVVVLGVAFGVRAAARRLAPGDYQGTGTGSVTVQVRAGETATDIGATLSRARVVKTAQAFRRAAVEDKRSAGIQPGYYRLRTQMSAESALGLLLSPTSRVSSRVVVPEASTVAATLAIVASAAKIPIADLRRAAADPAELGLPAVCRGQLEGCLFPATYALSPGTSAAEALEQMVQRFSRASQDVGLVPGAAALRRTPYQVLIVASLLGKEVRRPADLPKVARVIYNRLDKGIALGLDSTAAYATGNFTGKLSAADLNSPSPYNTRKHRGLTPTPINSPGMTALRAALHPATGTWEYFVTVDRSGRTVFTDTYPEFLKWKAVAGRNGAL